MQDIGGSHSPTRLQRQPLCASQLTPEVGKLLTTFRWEFAQTGKPAEYHLEVCRRVTTQSQEHEFNGGEFLGVRSLLNGGQHGIAARPEYHDVPGERTRRSAAFPVAVRGDVRH